MNYENYLSYPKAIQEAVGHLVDWLDLEIDDSIDSADETDLQNNTSVNNENEIEDTTNNVSEDPK